MSSPSPPPDVIQTNTHEWMADLHKDVNADTGYIAKHPKGVYGKKVKELVQYASSQSVEMKAIRHSRRVRPHACLVYFAYVFHFLSEYVLPIVLSTASAYLYYQWTPEPVAFLPPVPKPIETNTTSSGWFDWVPSSDVAGDWLGTTLRSIVAVPVTFVAHTVDRGLRVQEVSSYLQSSGSKIILLPLLFVAVYLLTKLVCRLMIHIQSLCASQQRLWNLQEMMLTETEEALERAVTGILRPALLTAYETLLLPPPSSTQLVSAEQGALLLLANTYRGNVPMMRTNLLDRLSTEIKRIPFPELVRRGGLSQSYSNAMRQLIRYADEELSSTLFSFHEEISSVPLRITQSVVGAGNGAIQGAARVTSTAMTVAAMLA